MNENDLRKMNPFTPINAQPFESYLPTAFDDSLSMLEKLNKVIYGLNQVGELTNEMLEKWNQVIDWLLHEGLTGAIQDQLNTWLNDGTLAKIINEEIFADLNKKIDDVHTSIINSLKVQSVNVQDYGAKGDGSTDDTEAFEKALNSIYPVVFVPNGTYRVTAIRMPSDKKLIGADMEKTIIKLVDSAPLESNLLTNKDPAQGNRNIKVENLTLDWNKERVGGDARLTTGLPDGCALIFINTQYSYVTNVFAKNPARHCFDVSASRYPHTGDSPTVYMKDGCQYIYFEGCRGTGSGDDIFTTHMSKYIYFDDCIAMSPDGTLFAEGDANANGFEIDDGSQNVFVLNCYAVACIRGFEAKAHESAPAAQNVTFNNCMAEDCVRGFEIRHSGHESATDPFSETAMSINISNCTVIRPRKNNLKPTLDPHALFILAYRNVNVSNFQAIGGGDGVTTDVISIQSKARLINLSNISIRYFKLADTDIRLSGGDNRSALITIDNVNILMSALQGIAIGTEINDVTVSNVTAQNDNRAGSIGLNVASTANPTLINNEFISYEHSATLGGSVYDFSPNVMRQHSMVMASVDSKAVGDKSVVVSSSSSVARGERSFVASSGSDSEASGEYSSVISARTSKADATRATVLSSYGVVNPQGNSVVGGYGTGAKSSANRTWQLNSENGNITAKGTVTSGGNFSDYGEYFESENGEAIPTGTIVTLVGSKIKPAEIGDPLLGVISETAGVVMGANEYHWQGRYKTNEFGGLVYEKQTVTEWDEYEGQEYQVEMVLPVENPDYVDMGEDYKSRAERPEWNIVGLVGQVYVRIDDTVKVGDTITAISGIATTGDSDWRVMAITSLYNEEKGYGVAKVMIR